MFSKSQSTDTHPSGYENRYQSTAPSVTQYHGGYYGAQRRPDGFQDDGTSPLAPPSRNRFNQRISGNGNGNGNMSRSHSSYGMSSPHGYNYPEDAGMNSDSTGPWNNSTDPSSENSSIDRAHAAAAKLQAPMEGYSYNDGYQNGAPIMEEYDSGSDGYGMSRHVHNVEAPAMPVQSQAPPVRAPIKLGGTPSQGGSLPSMTRKESVKEEKKKGFFKKRFSKG